VVCKKFGERYQKTNKTEDTNKLTLLAFKIIAILHNTLLATSIKFLETVSKGLFRNRSQNSCHTFLDCRRAATYAISKTSVLDSMAYNSHVGASGGAVVEALSYKPEGHGIDPRWFHWKFSLT
jgi:hypothetical protein